MGKTNGGVMAAGAVLDLTVVASVASVAYGSWMVFPAAGFIVGGLLALCLSLGLAAGASKNPRTDVQSRVGGRE